MTWGGLVKSISKKWNIQEIFPDQSSNALAFTRGLNMESTFVCIEKITQKQVEERLAQKKISSLKETDFKYVQESESVEIGFLWGPKHEQFSNASLSALNLKKHFET